jgi:hypothetical protein
MPWDVSAAEPASKAAFHCRYCSPKRTTTTSAHSISDRVRMAFTPGTDVVVPELRSLVAGDRRAGIVGPGS